MAITADHASTPMKDPATYSLILRGALLLDASRINHIMLTSHTNGKPNAPTMKYLRQTFSFSSGDTLFKFIATAQKLKGKN